MVQEGFLPEAHSRKPIQQHPLGNGLALEMDGARQGRCNLLHYDKPIKSEKFSDKIAKKLLVIEAVELGARR